MEKIEPGRYVQLTFDIYETNPGQDDVLIAEHQTENLILGVTQGVLPAMERGLEGLSKDDEFDIRIPAAEGFPYNPDDVVELDKAIFNVDGKFDSEMVRPGAYVPMATAEGYRITGKVLEVTDHKVKLDFNHPFTGRNLRFHGTVDEVREATDEDLHPTPGCGGCCGGCDSDCSEGSCSEGCGCQ